MATEVAKETRLLAKHSVVYALGVSLNSAISFLMLPIYTRFLTPADYGIKELVGLTVDVVGILLATAIASPIFRFYFEYEDTRDRNEVISTAIIAFGSFGFLALLLLSLSTKLMAQYVLDSPEYYHYFLLALATMWFNSMITVAYNYLRANRLSLKFLLISLSKLLLALSLNIYLVAYAKLGVLGILISSLVSSILICLFFVIPLVCKTGLTFSPNKARHMIQYGLPLIPSQLGAFVVHLSDRFFIKAFCSLSDTGLYSLAYRFGTLPTAFITTPFNQVWAPRRLESYKENGSDEVFGQVFTYFCLILFFAGLAVASLTKDILMIMADSRFWSAHRIVPILVLATTIFSFHYHFTVGIAISKKTKYLAYINGSNAAIVLILNFILIRKYGVWGAASVTLIAFIYKVALIYLVSGRFHKIHVEFRRILKLAVVACLIWIICSLVDIQQVWISFSCKIIMVSFFPVILYLVGFFSPEEKAYGIKWLQGKGLPTPKRTNRASGC